MKRLFGILFVFLLSWAMPMTYARANELDPYNSDTSVSFYGEYYPSTPGTNELGEPTSVPTAEPTVGPTDEPSTEPQSESTTNPNKNTTIEQSIVPMASPTLDKPNTNNPETNDPEKSISLPQTGDSSNLPYVYGGLIILISCVLIAVGKMQYALKRHLKYYNY